MPESPVMTNMPGSPHSQLFTVRVWREELGEGRSEWRVQARHVLSGETRYFRDWPSLVTFIIETATMVEVLSQPMNPEEKPKEEKP